MRVFIAPRALCIYHDTLISKKTVEFFQSLFIAGERAPVILDLRNTEYVSAAAALMLFAHVNALQLRHNSKHRVRCIFPSRKDNPKGHANIVGLKLSRALVSGSEEALNELVKDGVPFQSSNDPDVHAAKTITYLTEKLALPSGNQLVLMLTAAISEAMLNVKHHAYEYERSIFTGVLEHRWWQYALFDEDESRFIFLIYDLGLGILKSYKATVEPSMADNHILEEALSVGGSRFRHDEPWRGNGSEDLKHPIDIGETLLICCDDMRYVYRGAGQPTTIERTPFLVSGNLIEWTLETEVKKEGT